MNRRMSKEAFPFLMLLVGLCFVAAEANAIVPNYGYDGGGSAFNLGLNIGYNKGGCAYCGNFAQPFPVMGPQAFGGFQGMGQQFQNGSFGAPFGNMFGGFGGGGYQASYGPFPWTPGGPSMVTYNPWARETDTYSFGQIGVAAAQYDAPLPPDVIVYQPNGQVVQQVIDEDSRFMHELKQAVRSNMVFPIDGIAPPTPDLNVFNNYDYNTSYPTYNYNNTYNYPDPPGPIPPGPIPPGPGPIFPPIILPGGHGGVNPTI